MLNLDKPMTDHSTKGFYNFFKVSLITILLIVMGKVLAQDATHEKRVELDEIKQMSISRLDVTEPITHFDAIEVFGKLKPEDINIGEGDKVEYTTLIVPYRKADLFYKIPWKDDGASNVVNSLASYKQLLKHNASFYTEFYWDEDETEFPKNLQINGITITQQFSETQFASIFPKSAKHVSRGWHEGESLYELSLCPYNPELGSWIDIPAAWFTFKENRLISFEYSAGNCTDLSNQMETSSDIEDK